MKEEYIYENLHVLRFDKNKSSPFIFQDGNESKEGFKKYEELQKQITSSYTLGKFRKYLKLILDLINLQVCN